jgi:hypothetical protein
MVPFAAALVACSSSSSSNPSAGSVNATVAATDLGEVIKVADAVGGSSFIAHPKRPIHAKKGGTVPCEQGIVTTEGSSPTFSFDFERCVEGSVTLDGSVSITGGGWTGNSETLVLSGGPLTVTDPEGTHTISFNGPVTVTVVISPGTARITTAGSVTVDGMSFPLTNVTVLVAIPEPSDAGTSSTRDSSRGDTGASTYTGKTLYTGQTQPGVLAVDSVNLYWQSQADTESQTESIVRAPKAGGASNTPTTLVTLAASLVATQILADGTNVYWTEQVSGGPGPSNGSLVSLPIAGGKPTTLVAETGSNEIHGQFAIDDTYAYYFTETSAIELNRVPLAGGAAESLASIPFPSGTFGPPTFGGLAVDDANVYWAEFGFPGSDIVVAKAPKAGGAIVTLTAHDADEVQVYGCVVDSQNVYWLGAKTTNGEFQISSVPIAGGSVSTVGKSTLSNLPGNPPVLPTGLALVNDNFYFSTLQALVAQPKSGGAVATLATTPLQGDPVFFASDGANLYWTLEGDQPTQGSIVTAKGL